MTIDPFLVSPAATLRTGLSNHERPFDRLRVNGRKRPWLGHFVNHGDPDWDWIKERIEHH